MMGNISLAQSHLPAEHPSVKNMDKALTAMDRAAELTQQMLAYSGKGRYQVRTIDLNDTVRDHGSLHAISVPKNVRLTHYLSHSPVLINGDAGQINQVLMNLIINGGEAIGTGQGTVTVIVSETVIDAKEAQTYARLTNAALKAGTYAYLEVSDTGSGMSADTITKMFDPFFTTKFTGRGLGLSAVLGIIQGHQGGIRVESAVGAGTTIRIILPSIPAPVTNADHR
jgi:signal transduction histidine kinase